MAVSKWEKSLIETAAVRPFVKKDLLPLFDHCIVLAKDSHKRGYAKRAGQELLHARKLAKK